MDTSAEPEGRTKPNGSPTLPRAKDLTLIEVKDGAGTYKNGLIAVIPTYNDQATIGSVIVQALRFVDGVIVVDDNSTDKTPQVAKCAGAEVISLHIHTGKAYALLLGLKSARDHGCKAVITLDADGHQHIHDIPKLAAHVLNGEADLVIGSLYHEKSLKAPFPRKFQSDYFRSLHQYDPEIAFTDLQSKFRAISRKALEDLSFDTKGYNIQSDIVAHFLKRGLIIEEIQLTNIFSPPTDTYWGNPIKVLAAMPAFNEEKYIAKTIVGARKYVDQVLVIDDGSSDSTKEIAEGLGAIVIRHEKNIGYGAALQSIFNKARELHVDALVILDADGQHNPEDVGRLLNALVECEADVAIGSRFLKDDHKEQIPGYRKVGMKVLDGATRIAGVAEISDSQSGFRAYGKKAIEVIQLSGEGMSAGSEILIQISDNNLKIAEVPIKVRYDIEDTSSQHPVRHGVSVLYKLIGLISYRRPLLTFGTPGLILVIIGIIAGSRAFTEYYITTRFPFILSMVSGMFLILGILLAITGLILNSIVMIINVNKKA
jgi:glycosyltransferase involved in cell wall biosynthesis